MGNYIFPALLGKSLMWGILADIIFRFHMLVRLGSYFLVYAVIPEQKRYVYILVIQTYFLKLPPNNAEL
jgi:hypothetical protein